MSGSIGLSVNDVVSVSTSFNGTPVATRNFGSLMIAGPSAVIPIGQRFQLFTSIDDVAALFGTTAPEYYAADNFFEQSPAPQQFVHRAVGAQTPTSAVLTSGPILPDAASCRNHGVAVCYGRIA